MHLLCCGNGYQCRTFSVEICLVKSAYSSFFYIFVRIKRLNISNMKSILQLLTVLFLLCTSCENKSDKIVLHHLELIKERGNVDPFSSLEELRTIEQDVATTNSPYVWNKYQLLRARLSDKADLIPTSSDTIDAVVQYFEENGSSSERTEAYYYQASVYRDLKDYPRAMTSFLKVLDGVPETRDDSILLQNTYSQLAWMYEKEQIFPEALKMAKAGCEMAKKTKTIDPIYMMDVATVSLMMGDTVQGIKVSKEIMSLLTKDSVAYLDVACEILSLFSEKDMKGDASECVQIINNASDLEYPPNYLYGMANYSEHFISVDSAALYYRRILNEIDNMSQKMASSNWLMNYNYQKGNYAECCRYALIFSECVDSVFSENKYEQTSRACGNHLYLVSRNKEQAARDVADLYKRNVYLLILFVMFLALLFSIMYGRRKKHFIRELLNKEDALKSVKQTLKQYDVELQKKELSISEQMMSLRQAENEMSDIQERMKAVAKEKEELIKNQESQMQRYSQTIAEYEVKLLDKQKQIKELVRLALLEKASVDNGLVLQRFKEAAEGREKLTTDDWHSLYTTIETSNPGFSEALANMARPSELIKKTAYLMKLGMSNSQIGNITDSPRQSVWSRVELIKDKLGTWFAV